MGGSKFQYDESGGTFFYFLLSFLALVLLPSSYYFWPRKEEEDDRHQQTKLCQCDLCVKKRKRLRSEEPWRKTKHTVIKFLLVLGWLAFCATAYKVAHLERDHIDWDPFEILQIDKGASQNEIKKAYRKLSLIYHPDKETGDARKFMQISKAHAALTDEDAKKNWELYGNPDGPGAMSFGIALPSWIVEKENSFWVLGLYALVFMVALPTVVGAWWYKSIKYGGDQVLLDTTQMYFYFFHKTPSMALKRALMILAASFEFHKEHNNEIIERPSDNEEVPMVMKELTNLGEKNKEPPLCCMYSVKARTLLHAHLTRLKLPSDKLEHDKNYVVKKCPYLIQEMVQCVAQLIMLAHAGRIVRMPTLESIENSMKLSAMIVQALWDKQSPLLQLPHLTEDMLRHFVTKKRNIRSIYQLVRLKPEERRSLLRTLSDEQYRDAMRVCAQMPLIQMDVKSEVLDDEDSWTITAGAIVTVTVTLTRKNMETIFDKETLEVENQEVAYAERDEEANQSLAAISNEQETASSKKQPVWQKQKRKGKGAKPKKKVVNKAVNVAQAKKNQVVVKNEKTEATVNSEKNNDLVISKSVKDDESDDDESIYDGGDSESGGSQDESKDEGKAINDDDDDEWEKFQSKLSKKERILETKLKKSHSVHCPYFPEDKQEYWWVYIANRKKRSLITMPYQVTNLVDQVEVQLKFTAPQELGYLYYVVILRSDSYIDFDQFKNITLDVKEAKEVDQSQLQWDISEDEKEEQDEASENSEFTTDEDVDSDHD